jgi:hypothetical protein
MSVDDPTAKSFSIKRWSQKKLEAARAAPEPTPVPGPAPASAPAPVPDPAPVAPADAGTVESSTPVVDAASLPPVEALTIDSDFSAFLDPKVDEGLKRRALRQLFRDPHFNVMDGLDVYVGDYATPDPISPEIVRELVQARYIFDPPKTRVNADGALEDVPTDDAAAEPVAPPESAPVAPVVTTQGPTAHDAAEPEPAAGAPPAGSLPVPR